MKAPPVSQPLRLLLVEDSAFDADVIIRALRANGYEPHAHIVETEPDYLTALDEAPDIVLSDYNLPAFDGLRALDLLLKRKPEIPFILVSGTIGDELAVESLRRGATDYLLKDRLGRLGAAVERALEIRRVKDEQRRKAKLTELLEALARIANEATNPVEAMRRCLEHIVEHGGWALGGVHIISHTGEPEATYWYMPAPARRYTAFTSLSASPDPRDTADPFLGRVFRDKRPAWIADTTLPGSAERIAQAAHAGLRSAFAFPVIVHHTVAAVLEFFAKEPGEPDELLLDAITSVSGQLARLIERHRAETRIRASEARLRAILDNEPECVKVFDTDGTLVEMNRAGLAMLEVESIEQVRDIGLETFVSPEYRERFASFIDAGRTSESNELEFEMVSLKGTRRCMEAHAGVMQFPDGGDAALLVVTRDITDRKRAEQHANYLSRYDVVTGLPNRNLFRDRLDFAFAHARRRGELLGVMVMNLDRFQKVNENLGNEAGDAVLRDVAARLKDSLRDIDTVARVGGNEYAVLIESVAAAADVMTVAEKLAEALTAPFEIQGHEVFVTASIGVAAHSDSVNDAQTLLEHAEAAMWQVKHEGGSGHQLFEQKPDAQRSQRFAIENQLRQALAKGELRVHYQPKVNLATGTITGAEALLRWTSPQLGEVSPAQFIPIAEETGLIVPIGGWVLETACAQVARWREAGRDLNVAVNLSPRQFRQKDLVGTVAIALTRSGVDAQSLELEITEGTAMANVGQTVAVLAELRELGVKLAVDDFGTGYSSLSYLKRFPLHSLKIDRSFVRDLETDPNSNAIVRATIALAHSLNLRVVAEGIETAAQRDILVENGCDDGQGYLYSPALPAEEFSLLIEGTA